MFNNQLSKKMIIPFVTIVISMTFVVSYNFVIHFKENNEKLRVTINYVFLILVQNYIKPLIILSNRKNLILLLKKFRKFIESHPKCILNDEKFLRVQLKVLTIVVASSTFMLQFSLTAFSYIFSVTTGDLDEPYITATKLPGTK